MSTPYRGPGPNDQGPTHDTPNPYPAEAPYRPEETLLSGQYGQPAQQGLVAAPVVKERNVIGIIALVCAVLGLILSCIKGILLLGWILLPIGFILGVVGLFPKNKAKGTALGAVVTSIIGFIVAAVVFTMVIDDAFNDAFNKETTVTNEGNRGAVRPGAPTEGQNVTAEGGDNPQGEMPFVHIEYVTPQGNSVDGYATVVPEPFDMAETLFNGASTTGNFAFLVDEATAAEGVLSVAPDMFSQKKFVALQMAE